MLAQTSSQDAAATGFLAIMTSTKQKLDFSEFKTYFQIEVDKYGYLPRLNLSAVDLDAQKGRAT